MSRSCTHCPKKHDARRPVHSNSFPFRPVLLWRICTYMLFTKSIFPRFTAPLTPRTHSVMKRQGDHGQSYTRVGRPCRRHPACVPNRFERSFGLEGEVLLDTYACCNLRASLLPPFPPCACRRHAPCVPRRFERRCMYSIRRGSSCRCYLSCTHPLRHQSYSPFSTFSVVHMYPPHHRFAARSGVLDLTNANIPTETFRNITAVFSSCFLRAVW
ncbi:unnamed protein product [Ectocarpus sp. 12 AP-2014]